MSKSGWEKDSFFDYLAHPGCSSSRVRKVLRSPAHGQATDDYNADNGRIGSNIHGALLEPERFEKEHIIMPSDKRTTIKGKAVWEGFFKSLEERGKLIMSAEAANALPAKEAPNSYSDGSFIVKRQEYIDMRQIRENCLKHRGIRWLLENCEYQEKSGYLNLGSVSAKIRPDLGSKGKRFMADIKSTEDARKFKKAIENYQYHVQMGQYVEVGEILDEFNDDTYDWYWIVIEKTPPFGVMRWIPDQKMMDIGRKAFLYGFNLWSRCMEENVWPNYDDDDQQAYLSKWSIVNTD